MTTQELHIGINTLLQKTNSNWNKNFLPQELDFFINREITKFIKQRINPLSNAKRLSVFDTIKRDIDLNKLLKSVTLPLIDANANINRKEDIVYLPFNYLYYVSASLEVIPTCKPVTFNPNPISHKSISINSITNTPPTFIVITVLVNGGPVVVFDLTTLPIEYVPQDNIANYKKAFIFNNAILNVCRKNLPSSVEIKYNKSNNTFIFKSTVPGFAVLYELDGIAQPTTIENSVFFSAVDPSLTSEVIIIDEEFKTPIQKSYLSGSKDEKVVGYLRDNFISFPRLNNVVYNSITLTYISMPDKIDLLLQHNSNLTDAVLEEVLGNTVASLKAVLSSDTYEKFAADNMLVE